MTDKSGPVTAQQIISLGKLRERVGIDRYREIVLMMFDSPQHVDTKYKARRLWVELNKEAVRQAEKAQAEETSGDIEEMDGALYRLRAKIHTDRLKMLGRSL